MSCSHDMQRHGYRLGGWYMRQARYGGSVPGYFRKRCSAGLEWSDKWQRCVRESPKR